MNAITRTSTILLEQVALLLLSLAAVLGAHDSSGYGSTRPPTRGVEGARRNAVDTAGAGTPTAGDALLPWTAVPGTRTAFHLTYPVSGRFAEVPVRIVYRPRWWFEAELTLEGRP